MLIEFSVENFGSVREPQVLEMVPVQTIRRMSDNCFSTGLSTQPRRLLRSAIVYGPNASGKTHLVNAAAFMREMVLNSNRKRVEDPIQVNPFLLDSSTRSAPSAFQMIFIADGCRHQYGFKVDHQRVWSEWYDRFSRSQVRTIFYREYRSDSDGYSVETDVDGLREEIQKLPDDWLALSKLGQQKRSSWPEMSAAYGWFQQKLRIINPKIGIKPFETLQMCIHSTGRDWVLNFLQAADLVIEDLQIVLERDGIEQFIKWFTNHPVEMPKSLKDELSKAVNENDKDALARLIEFRGGELKTVRIIPETGEAVPFSMHMESSGTQQMLALAGCWKAILQAGQVCFMDEIETSLHPKLARFLLELIHDPEHNPRNAQLVATTHDTSLLDERLVRPDQVWLMNKDRAYASRLYPLSDFDIRLKRHQTLQQSYLDGLFGAIPMVRKRRLPVLEARGA